MRNGFYLAEIAFDDVGAESRALGGGKAGAMRIRQFHDLERPGAVGHAAQEAALFEGQDQAMDARLGLQVEGVFHFLERGGDSVFLEAFIDEKEQFKLFARQHGVTCSKNVPGKSSSKNRNKNKTKITVLVWFSKSKLAGRSKIHQNEVD